MTTFLLVHGAWQGGWCWREVAAILRAHGHDVLAPSLTGLGDRAHLLGTDPGLALHAADLRALIDAAEADAVTLVGHSYGARPAALAADHPAVAAWISLDGVPVLNGANLFAGAAPELVAASRAACTPGPVPALPPLPPKAIGVPDDHPGYDRVARRQTAMPWRCLEEPMPAPPDRFHAIPRAYVTAVHNHMDGPKAAVAEARQAGWPVHAIDSGHHLPVTAPAETAALLLRLPA